jgi:hypothetical protein
MPTLIAIPTPIAVPNESAGDTQAKNLFGLFLHHHLLCILAVNLNLTDTPTTLPGRLVPRVQRRYDNHPSRQ